MNVTGSGTKWLGEDDADPEKKIHLFLLCKAGASLVCPLTAGVSFLCSLPLFHLSLGGILEWVDLLGMRGGKMVKNSPKMTTE